MTQNQRSMNKKGEFDIFIIFGIFILIVALFALVIDTTFSFNEKDKACKEIGFEEEAYWIDIPGCEDLDGDIHYVKFDCTIFKFWNNKCSAKPIKVGEVYGTKG